MQDKHKNMLRAAVVLAAVAYFTKPYWLNKPDAKAKPAEVAATVKADIKRTLGTLTFKPCSLAQGSDSITAYCSTLSVPEDHSKPDGRKIDLAISWL